MFKYVHHSKAFTSKIRGIKNLDHFQDGWWVKQHRGGIYERPCSLWHRYGFMSILTYTNSGRNLCRDAYTKDGKPVRTITLGCFLLPETLERTMEASDIVLYRQWIWDTLNQWIFSGLKNKVVSSRDTLCQVQLKGADAIFSSLAYNDCLGLSLTSSWLFLRQRSSSFKDWTCASRSSLPRVSAFRICRRPLISASTSWRRDTSASYL